MAPETDKLLGEIETRPGGDVIRIRETHFKGFRSIDIRRFYWERGSNELKPSNKGISIPANRFYEVMQVLKSVQIPVGGEVSEDGTNEGSIGGGE